MDVNTINYSAKASRFENCQIAVFYLSYKDYDS